MAKTTWCSFLGDSSYSGAVALLGLRMADRMGLLGARGPGASAMDPRTVLRWVEAQTGRRPGEPAPDLCKVLDAQGFSGAARDDVRRFEELLRPRASGCFVGRCVADDAGSFAVAVYRGDRPGAHIGVGDTFFSGVQLSGDVKAGVVLAEPHVLRRVCVNGATVVVASDSGVYARWAGDDVEGDLQSVVELGFSGAILEGVQADMRRAVITPPPSLASLRERGFLRIDDALAASIAEAARGESQSLFGVYNAMTRVARDTQDVRTAVGLERMAGRLIAALIRHPQTDLVAHGDLVPS